MPTAGFFASADVATGMLGQGRPAEDVFLAMLSLPDLMRARLVSKGFKASVATWRGSTGIIQADSPRALLKCRACLPNATEVALMAVHSVRQVTAAEMRALAGARSVKFFGLFFTSTNLPEGFSAPGSSVRSLTFNSCNFDMPPDCLACCTRLERLKVAHSSCHLDLRGLEGSLRGVVVDDWVTVDHTARPVVVPSSLWGLARLEELHIESDHNAYASGFKPGEGNVMLANLKRLVCPPPACMTPGFTLAACPRLEELEVVDHRTWRGNRGAGQAPDHIEARFLWPLPAGLRLLQCNIIAADALPLLARLPELYLGLPHQREVPNLTALAGLQKLTIGYCVITKDDDLDRLPQDLRDLSVNVETDTFWGRGLARFGRLESLQVDYDARRTLLAKPGLQLTGSPVLLTLKRFTLKQPVPLPADILERMPQLQCLTVPLHRMPVVSTAVYQRSPHLREVRYNELMLSGERRVVILAELLQSIDLAGMGYRLARISVGAALVNVGGSKNDSKMERQQKEQQLAEIAAHARAAVARANTSLPWDSHARWEVAILNRNRDSDNKFGSMVPNLVLYRFGCRDGVPEDFEPPSA